MTLNRQILFVDEPVPALQLVHAPDPETELAVVVVLAVVVAERRVGVWAEAMRT